VPAGIGFPAFREAEHVVMGMGTRIANDRGIDTGYDIIPYPDMDLTPLSVINEAYDKLGDLSDFLEFPKRSLRRQ
jgi:hypothetical protein